jgi:transposase
MTAPNPPSKLILVRRYLAFWRKLGYRGGFDGHKKRKGSKVHAAVDTLGHLLALKVTPANEQDRAQVGELAQAVQAAVDEPVQLAFVDQGYTGEQPAAAAAQEGIQLEVVKHHEARSQARIRSIAKALGGRAILRLGRPVPPLGARL